MLLKDFIEKSIETEYPVFDIDSLAHEVLEVMETGPYDSLPVLHEGKLHAVVTLQDLLQARHLDDNESLPLRELPLYKPASIFPEEHLLDVFQRLRLLPGTLVPLSGRMGEYIGCVRKIVFYEKIAEIFRLGDDGMTIELDLPSIGLKLSEVIAIIEKNDATVVSFGMYHASEMVAAFRVQTHDFFRLVTNLEKYGYSIRFSSPFQQEKDESLREKALEFIRFMDM